MSNLIEIQEAIEKLAPMARQTGLPLATTDDHFDRVTNLAVLNW
jgi:predicted nucleic acid-binding protein